MADSRRELTFSVSFDDDVWEQEVGRLSSRSAARVAAESARGTVERKGIGVASLARCETEAEDGTRLKGCVKLRIPLAGPPSESPYGFVFEAAIITGGTPTLRLLAFGERHPAPGVRSTYERAHKRIHGSYPDE